MPGSEEVAAFFEVQAIPCQNLADNIGSSTLPPGIVMTAEIPKHLIIFLSQSVSFSVSNELIQSAQYSSLQVTAL